MKKKKVFLVSIALFLLVATSMIINVHLYTKEQVYNLGKSIGEGSWYGSQDLGSLLINNMQEISPSFFVSNKNGWRDLIASNPTLAYSAVDYYYNDFLEGFKDGFDEQKKSQLGYMLKNNSGGKYSEYDIDMALSKNSDDFLRITVANIKKYQSLIDDLLTTGSTANELAKALKKQGVERVDVWCCARAVDDLNGYCQPPMLIV